MGNRELGNTVKHKTLNSDTEMSYTNNDRCII